MVRKATVVVKVPRLLGSLTIKAVKAVESGSDGEQLAFEDLSNYLKEFDEVVIAQSTIISVKSGIGKFVILFRMFAERFKKGITATEDDEERLSLCLELIDLYADTPKDLLEEEVLDILGVDLLPLLSTMLANSDNSWSRQCRIAETMSLLVESTVAYFEGNAARIKEVLQHMTKTGTIRILGKIAGDCGNYMIQGNIVEIVTKFLRAVVNWSDPVDAMKKVLPTHFCKGIAGHATDESKVGIITDLFLSIVHNTADEESLVDLIRQWLNTVNEERAKHDGHAVRSFRVQKVLIGGHDMQREMWVDFNKQHLLVNGVAAELQDGSTGPLLIRIDYPDISSALGRPSNKTIVLSVRSCTDLLTSELKPGTEVAFEFTHSDFYAMGHALQNMGVKVDTRQSQRRAAPPAAREASGRDKSSRGPAVPRKVSMAYSCEVLELLMQPPPRQINSGATTGPQPVHQVALAAQKRCYSPPPFLPAAEGDYPSAPVNIMSSKRVKIVPDVINVHGAKLIQMLNDSCAAVVDEYARARAQFDRTWTKKFKSHQDAMQHEIRETMRQLAT